DPDVVLVERCFLRPGLDGAARGSAQAGEAGARRPHEPQRAPAVDTGHEVTFFPSPVTRARSTRTPLFYRAGSAASIAAPLVGRAGAGSDRFRPPGLSLST